MSTGGSGQSFEAELFRPSEGGGSGHASLSKVFCRVRLPSSLPPAVVDGGVGHWSEDSIESCDKRLNASFLFMESDRRGRIVRCRSDRAECIDCGESVVDRALPTAGRAHCFSKSSRYEMLFSLRSDSKDELNTGAIFWFLSAVRMVTLRSL